MYLQLNGRFTHIDKYGKLHFITSDDKSKNKLEKHTNKPGDTFICIHKCKYISRDILDMVGKNCSVYVRLVNYNFVSKLDRNKGEHIRGVNLYLINIYVTS